MIFLVKQIFLLIAMLVVGFLNQIGFLPNTPAILANTFVDTPVFEYNSTAEKTTITEALAVMQNQYNDFVSNLTIILTIGGVGLTVVIFVVQRSTHRTIKNQVDMEIKIIKEKMEDSSDKNDRLAEKYKKAIRQIPHILDVTLKHEFRYEIDRLSDEAEDMALSKYTSACIHSSNENYDTAFELINNAIDIDSAESRYYDLRSYIHRKQNELDFALADIDKAIDVCDKKSNDFLEYTLNKGVILHQQKNMSKH